MGSLLENKLNAFLGKSEIEDLEQEKVKRTKKDKSLLERVNRTILTEGNKQLLL